MLNILSHMWNLYLKKNDKSVNGGGRRHTVRRWQPAEGRRVKGEGRSREVNVINVPHSNAGRQE
jgi:hypothetical protein